MFYFRDLRAPDGVYVSQDEAPCTLIHDLTFERETVTEEILYREFEELTRQDYETYHQQLWR